MGKLLTNKITCQLNVPAGRMIEYFSPNSGVTLTEAYLSAGGVVAMTVAWIFSHHIYLFSALHTGMKLRVASCSLLYRKALKLSNTALGQTTVGQMVNLLSNDVKRFDQAVMFLHYLWAGPLQLTIITVLLYQKIGPSALVGAALLILAVPLQSNFITSRNYNCEKVEGKGGMAYRGFGI